MNRPERGVNSLERINGILREKKLNKERNSNTRPGTPLSRSSQHLERPQRQWARTRKRRETTLKNRSMDQRKGGEEENSSEEPTDRRKEEISEEAMAASSLFAHPCSLLQYIARVCACCLGFRDSFSDPKPGAARDAPAPASSSREWEDKKPSYFYMQEVITHVWTARRRPRPTPPGNPIEGGGGNGGQHN